MLQPSQKPIPFEPIQGRKKVAIDKRPKRGVRTFDKDLLPLFSIKNTSEYVDFADGD